jgi:hypothetical protein
VLNDDISSAVHNDATSENHTDSEICLRKIINRKKAERNFQTFCESNASKRERLRDWCIVFVDDTLDKRFSAKGLFGAEQIDLIYNHVQRDSYGQ